MIPAIRRCLPAAALALCAWAVLAWERPACGGEDDPAAKAYLAGDLRRARRILEREIASGTARPSRYLLLGRIQFMQRNWAGAKGTLGAMLKKDPDDPQARELLGRSLYRLGEMEESVEYYEEALGASDRAELRLELAEVLIGLKRKTEATKHLAKVIEDKQPWPRAHYVLGMLRLESGLGHWASRQLYVALKLGSREPGLRLALARAFDMEGRVTGPLHLAGPFPKARKGLCTDAEILVRPGPRAEDAGGDGGEADGLWYVAGADSALYQVEAALAEAKGGDVEEAVLLAGRCWLTAGELDMAEARAKGLKARSRQAFELRARLALATGDLAAFERLLKGAAPAEALPPGGLVKYLLDASLAAQVSGDLPAALRLLERADGALPGRSEVLRPMVQVLARMGRADQARVKMKLLAELHPDSPEVKMLAARHGIDLDAIAKAGEPVLKEKEKEKEDER